MHEKLWLKNFKGGDYLKGLGIDGRIVIKWILKKYKNK
jgi:hypothetical protein